MISDLGGGVKKLPKMKKTVDFLFGVFFSLKLGGKREHEIGW